MMAPITTKNFFQMFKEMVASTIGIRILTWTMIIWVPYFILFITLRAMYRGARWLWRKWNPSVIEVLVVILIGIIIYMVLTGVSL